MSEQQLERSVLESKEREELFAIATAIGTSPTARARKSDLIDQILRATGVEAAPVDGAPSAPVDAAPAAAAEEPRPRRTRARKAVAGASPAPDGAAAADVPPPSSAVSGGSAPDDATPDGAVPPAAAPDESPAQVSTAPPSSRPAPVGPASPTGTAASGARPSRDGRPAGPTSVPAGTAGGEAVAAGGPDGAGGGASDAEAAPRFEESGNRRSRRRRGRDRTERAERDLSGQVVDQGFAGEPVGVSGFLDLREEGYGFLRPHGHLPGPDDVYVSISQVRRFGLRRGDRIDGAARPAGGNEKYPALLRVDTVSGLSADEARERPRFDALTPSFPERVLGLGDGVAARVVGILAPIGAGARVLVAAPPRSGRRTLLRDLARGLGAANPDVEVIVVVVDERPEEVAELRRSLDAEVVATTFDRPPDEHVVVAELVVERAKRRVELGADVVLVFDGLTRLGRAHNLAQPASGRVLAGGIDTGSLHPPKRLFGAARNIEEAGSLTIIATALVDTGSRMDDVIFDELRDTANVEIRLDQTAAEARIFPALDVAATSARRPDAVIGEERAAALRGLRSSLLAEPSPTGLERLVDRVRQTTDDDQVLAPA